jgi:hypothetical protein
MKRPEKRQAKKKAPRKRTKELAIREVPSLPQKVDCETWLKRVNHQFRTEREAKKTLERWMQSFKESFNSHVPAEHIERTFLRRVYDKTVRVFMTDEEWQKHEQAFWKMQRLLPVLHDTITALEAVNFRVESRDGLARFRGGALHDHLKHAEEYLQIALDNQEGVLGKKKMHTPDVLTHCLSLIARQREIGIQEQDAVALCKIFMLCHGFSEGQLMKFSVDAVNNRAVHKSVTRFKAARKREEESRLEA